MNDQAKIERVIRLIILLSKHFGLTIKEIADKLEVSERTAYRYIETFRNAGLIIEKNKNGFFKLEKNNPYNKELNDLLHFSEEESYILQKA
ncbi:MAG: HTH domain-containing protein, partial [Chlorobi bacterium]|nr:HTH domain-containing protein [Chlorobiota bacterium]